MTTVVASSSRVASLGAPLEWRALRVAGSCIRPVIFIEATLKLRHSVAFLVLFHSFAFIVSLAVVALLVYFSTVECAQVASAAVRCLWRSLLVLAGPWRISQRSKLN